MNQNLLSVYNAAFELIELRLGKKEQVVPFSVSQTYSGEKPAIGMYEHITSNAAEQLDIIRSKLREKIKRKDIIALCLCYDVNIADPRNNKRTDAIAMELACNMDESMMIYVPYDFDSKDIIQTSFQTQLEEKYY